MKPLKVLGIALMIALSAIPVMALGTESRRSFVDDDGLVSHDPIVIAGDEDFTLENGVSSGSGTESNPYIIENYRIESYGYGISITDTSAIFIIRGCKIENGSSGIEFQRVKNGIIEGNIINNNKYFDINIFYSNNNTIRNNTCTSIEAESNINLVASSGNLIEKNQITGSSDWWNGTDEEQTENGINLKKDYKKDFWTNSGSNYIRGNLVLNHSNEGIWVRSDDNIIEGNIIINGSYGVLNEGNNNMISGNDIAGCKYGIYCWHFPSQILNNTCKKNIWGIFSGGTSTYNKEYQKDHLTYISNNTCMNNSEVGISLYKPGFDVQKNIVSNNGKDGIEAILDFIDDKGTSLIHNNLLKGNGRYGLVIKGDHNNETAGYAIISIYGNDFIDNGMTPQCEGTPKNTWNTSMYGNYWSDWTSPDADGDGIVDKPYVVNSTYNISDLKPITAPYDEWSNGTGNPSVLGILGNDIKVAMVNETYSSAYSVMGPGKDHTWSLCTNATWLNLSGSIISGKPCNGEVGTYWVNISVSWSGLFAWRNFTLEVVVWEPADWNEKTNQPPYGASIDLPQMRLSDGEPFTLSAKAFDPDIVHGDELRYEWFVDGLGLVGVGMNITLNLREGTYMVRLRVIDSFNRTLEVAREIIINGPKKGSMTPFIIASIVIMLLLVLLIALFVFRRRSERKRSLKERYEAPVFIDPEPPIGPMRKPLPFHGELEVRAGPLGPFLSNSENVNITSLEAAPFEGVRQPLDERREGLKLLLATKRDDFDNETYNALRGMIWDE